MKSISALVLLALVLSLAVATRAAAAPASLSGAVTDPSGAAVPNAVVLVRQGSASQHVRTDSTGVYRFTNLAAGACSVRVLAKGFAPWEQADVPLEGAKTIDVQLVIATETQQVTVAGEIEEITTDPTSNATSIVLRAKELEALSDDPDELASQLQAMAGPGSGPNGGQIYIDGFTGSNLPPKASIREVRINTNPFSPEYDRPGFGRIEIFTRPGTDTIRGQAFFQFNNQEFNSRSPLLTSAGRAPYENRFFGFSLSGPIRKRKASFGLDAERRGIDENAFILATKLDGNLNPVTVNQSVVTPQTRLTIAPRLDYSINANNTLVARYQITRVGMDNEGLGSYSLPERAYSQHEREHSIRLTETAILSPRLINETRFQFQRTQTAKDDPNPATAVSVAGAFDGGGSQVGNSSTLRNGWELSNLSTRTQGTHTFKWGARLRQSFLDDTSVSNFGGTFLFLGGVGPALDATGQPIAGTSVTLSALEVYRRTLAGLQAGMAPGAIRAIGGGASQFTLAAGQPTGSVKQFDAGVFWNDDWRLRPNVTLSYGLRYEAQTNLGDHGDWSPRVGIAWGVDGGKNRTARTVLRAGTGVFYDRVSDSLTLQSLRFNGVNQASYFIQNPDFYPTVPAAALLAGNRQPQQLTILDSAMRAPRVYQASLGLDRQWSKTFRTGVQYIATRGVHLSRTRNINTPVDGVYPFGDTGVRSLTETTGFSRTSQLVISPNFSRGKVFLFGFYGLSFGRSDAEGSPADPYNLRAEWGPSSFADVRHRFVLGSSVPFWGKLSISPFITGASGSPYNITTGIDSNRDGTASERPALLSNISAAACSGGTLRYAPGFGCFDLDPATGVARIGHNYARGPANFSVNLRLARSWSFGRRGESGPAEGGPPPGMGGVRGGGPPPGGGGPGGGGPPPGGGGPGGGGPPPGLFGEQSGKKFNLTLSVMARNVLNSSSYGAPSGDLSSPYFGQYRSLAGGFGPFGGSSTYNRKIDLQLRLSF